MTTFGPAIAGPADARVAAVALRLLASRGLAPPPENSQQCYLEISGQTLAPSAPATQGTTTGEPLAPVWNELISELLKQWQPAKPD